MQLNIATRDGIKKVEVIDQFEAFGLYWFTHKAHDDDDAIMVSEYSTGFAATRVYFDENPDMENELRNTINAAARRKGKTPEEIMSKAHDQALDECGVINE